MDQQDKTTLTSNGMFSVRNRCSESNARASSLVLGGANSSSTSACADVDSRFSRPVFLPSRECAADEACIPAELHGVAYAWACSIRLNYKIGSVASQQ